MLGFAVGALLLGKTIKDLNDASEMDERAQRKLERAYRREMEAKNLMAEKRHELEAVMGKVLNRKRAIVSSSLSKFIIVYENIQKIELEESSLISENNLPIISKEAVGGLQVLIPASRIEATGAEEFRAAITGGIGKCIVKDSERNLKAANATLRAANAVYSAAENMSEAVDEIIATNNRMNDVLGALNCLFIKAMNASEKIIKERGYNKYNYTLDDRKQLRLTMEIAAIIKGLIDKPLIAQSVSMGREIAKSIECANAVIQSIR